MDVKLVVIGGEHAGQAIPIRTGEFLIGRGEECHLRPQSKSISRKHCAIVVGSEGVTIEDFGSTNGTCVNGERIQQRRKLNSGDRIAFYKWEFELQVTADEKLKPRPKVHNVREAAARTVASAATGEEDVLDVEAWVEEDKARDSAAGRAKRPASGDTATGGRLRDTSIGSSTTQVEKVEDDKPPAKSAAQSRVAAKASTETASSAVDDLLRQFFATKR